MSDVDRERVEAFLAPYRDAEDFRADVDAFAFGDGEAMADRLAAFVTDGHKRATAGWLEDDDEDDAAVTVGGIEVILDGRGEPLCAIRTDDVRIGPLTSVDPAFAWDEGEGDRTRDDWLDGHERFFQRRAEAIGVAFDPDRSPVRFQRFSVVHPHLPADDWVVDDGALRVRPLRFDERGWIRALLGDRADAPDVLEASGGYAADACPALLARHSLQGVGLLVFVPRPDGVAVVHTSILDRAPDGVEDALRAGLDVLTERYGWGRES